MSEDLLRDRVRNSYHKETPEEWSRIAKEILAEGKRYKAIQDIVIRRPWNAIKEYLDKIIKEE